MAVLRDGARRMLMQAIEAEVAAFLALHAGAVDEAGRRRVVRNGHGPERSIQTGIGSISIRRPKVRDRGANLYKPIRFTSAVLPACLRRTGNVEELLARLYLKGVSTGQFDEALTVLPGPGAPGLPAATVRRLTSDRQGEHEHWQGRDLSARRYVCIPPRSPDRGSCRHRSAGLLAADGPMASISVRAWTMSVNACWF